MMIAYGTVVYHSTPYNQSRENYANVTWI